MQIVTTTPRDENNVPARLAVLNTDGVQGQNKVVLAITPSGHLHIDTMSTIAFTMEPVDPRDENYVGCWLFEGPDGLLYPAVANNEGELLVDM